MDTKLADKLKALEESEFDYMNEDARGMEKLYEICDEVEASEDPKKIFPDFFSLMESLPDSELGTPGPMVHLMESHIGSYEQLLEESIKRKPTNLSIWMVNRIANGENSNKSRWIGLLEVASIHPKASEETKNEAHNFIQRQKSL